MEAVDKVAQGIERDMLAQSHRHRKQARPLRPPSACFVIHESEDRAVHEMECDFGRLPCSTINDQFPQHRHVGVVTTQRPLVKRLLNRPERGASRPREHTADPRATAAQRTPTLQLRHT